MLGDKRIMIPFNNLYSEVTLNKIFTVKEKQTNNNNTTTIKLQFAHNKKQGAERWGNKMTRECF